MPTLFYGPGARDAAICEANRLGIPVHSAMGEGGLKVEDAREAVAILSAPAVGDVAGTLVLGPMDEANPKACDTLLKSIEEHRDTDVSPVLWAWDLVEVPPTIRSRCITQWAMGKPEVLPAAYTEAAFRICDAIVEGELHQVISTVQESKKDLELLGRSIAQCVASSALEGDLRFLFVWDSLRSQLGLTTLSPLGFTYALLKASLQVKRSGI
jgi:hypothetical protein